MISNTDKYRQMIQQTTKRIMLFPHINRPHKKPTLRLQCNIKLPSSHPFESNQQIENNTSITYKIIHQSSKSYTTQPHNQWPHSCIGLVLCEYHQNNQTLYVYGTGTLIHNNIVFTSAQNVYCRRLNTQYRNIRFITGVSGDKCSGIYDVTRVHYPNQYKMQENYENYNFAVLQLYDDLSDSCGYFGWNKIEDRKEVEKYTEYKYISDNQKRSFKLRQITKNEKSKQEYCSGNGISVNKNGDEYSIVGLKNQSELIVLNDRIRNMINQWTCSTMINLRSNKIDAQVLKYLCETNQPYLTQINLVQNRIDAQGCKSLSQVNWIHLSRINLNINNIDAQGCQYLSQANWKHLSRIYLWNNKINAQGCESLSRANWKHLKQINLAVNNIGAQGCKYLSQANWAHLTRINLVQNRIGAQGCKYLIQAKWRYLTQIDLRFSNICAQGCKYLSQSNWTDLTKIDLDGNSVDTQGYKYLSQTNWINLRYIFLSNNSIQDIIYRLLLLSSYPNTNIIT